MIETLSKGYLDDLSFQLGDKATIGTWTIQLLAEVFNLNLFHDFKLKWNFYFTNWKNNQRNQIEFAVKEYGDYFYLN